MYNFLFWAPTFAILLLEKNQCPADFETNGWGNLTYEQKTAEWHSRMQEVQGKYIFFSCNFSFFVQS